MIVTLPSFEVSEPQCQALAYFLGWDGRASRGDVARVLDRLVRVWLSDLTGQHERAVLAGRVAPDGTQAFPAFRKWAQGMGESGD